MCDLAPLTYIKRWKTYSKMNSGITEYSQGQGAGTTKAVPMFSKLMAQSSRVMEGVKNLVVKKHNLPVTKVTQSIKKFL